MFYNYVNEAYVGKKGVEELFKIFAGFRAKYKDVIFTTEMNRSEDLIRFNRMAEKIFGFKRFALFIGTTIGHINAFTIPFDVTWDRDSRKNIDPIISDKNGFRLREGTDLTAVVFITHELFRHDDFTDREIFAIFLHEVGHNFAFGIHEGVALMTRTKKTIESFKLVLLAALSVVLPVLAPLAINRVIITSSVCRDAFLKLDERFRKQGSLPFRALQWVLKINGFYTNLLINFYQFITFLNNVVNPIGSAVFGFLMSMHRAVRHVTSNMIELLLIPEYAFKNEQISDNFATFYGYGPELSSGLKKLDYGDVGISMIGLTNKIPFLSAVNDLVRLIQTIPMTMVDEHPEIPARIKAQLDYIENELEKNNLDPLVLAQLKRDKKEIEVVLEDLVDQSEEASHHTYFRRIFYGWLLTNHNGDWRLAALEDDTFKEIDKKYQENYKK